MFCTAIVPNTTKVCLKSPGKDPKASSAHSPGRSVPGLMRQTLELSLNARQIYFILLVYSTGLTFLSRIVLGLRRLPYHSHWLKVLNYPKAKYKSPSYNWLNVLNNSKLRCKVNANFAFKNRFLQHVNESETKWDYAVL